MEAGIERGKQLCEKHLISLSIESINDYVNMLLGTPIITAPQRL
jgi:hypothetical protein